MQLIEFNIFHWLCKRRIYHVICNRTAARFIFFLFLVIKGHVLIAIILGVLLKFMYSPSNGKHFDKPINDKEDLSTDAAQKNLEPEMKSMLSSFQVGDIIDGPFGPAPYSGVIGNQYTIDELNYKDGVYYYNENSEEWKEDEE